MAHQIDTITLTAHNVKLSPVVLRPKNDGDLQELTPNEGALHFDCVNDASADDDDTYVSMASDVSASDLYWITLAAHTGTITNIKVVARVKSHQNPQSEDGIYKIILKDSSSTEIFESDDFNLTTQYANYSKIWSTNPSTGSDWTWNELDVLQVGIECSSPAMTGYFTIYLSPDGNGYANQWDTLVGAASHWEAVDDEPPYNSDNAATMIYNIPPESSYEALIESFTLEDSPVSDGTIDSVIFSYRIYGHGDYASMYFGPKVRISASNYNLSDGAYYPASGVWATYPFTRTKSPATGNAWTWNEINNMEIAIEGYSQDELSGYDTIKLSQCYATINYHISTQPEIRTTQIYVEVNSEISTITCTLPSPEFGGITVSHDIDTNALNFWSGNREVYALGRSNKKLVLSGLLWDGCTDGTSTCEDIIHCIRALGKYGEPVDLAGLRYSDMNTEYNIVSFGWRQVSECPNSYEWQLELEFTELD